MIFVGRVGGTEFVAGIENLLGRGIARRVRGRKAAIANRLGEQVGLL
jgi:hypothetical protein